MTRHRTITGRPQRSAFTLVEVMISIALVLVLMLGINQIFKMATDTVGQGQALSAVVRDNRAVQNVIYTDARSMDSGGGPALIISSSIRAAFRNRQDELSDRDTNPLTIDIDGNNTEGDSIGEDNTPNTSTGNFYRYNSRNHRTDILSFFARGLFQRQTGNDGTYAARMTAPEAWMWYGHLNQADNDGNWDLDLTQPGHGNFQTNPNNFYANDWALGRMAMLLTAPDATTGKITDGTKDQEFIQRLTGADQPGNAAALSPLTWGSPATTGGFFVQDSRYDLAGTTIAQFKTDVTAVATTEAAWWQRLVFARVGGTYPLPAPTGGADYTDYRFQANRFFARPLDSAGAAGVAPILLPGCTQFIVEYAGDFLIQSANGVPSGNYTTGPTDNQTDFVIVKVNGEDVKQTRWYGMYRDMDGDKDGDNNPIELNFNSPDTFPLMNLIGAQAGFERVIPPSPTSAYSNTDPPPRYVCAWGPAGSYPTGTVEPPRPTMLRITVVIDDPNSRLAEGQTYEYVIKLP